MGIAVPSTALPNKRLTAQNAALEGRVKEQAIEIRRLREENAKLRDSYPDTGGASSNSSKFSTSSKAPSTPF